MNEETLLPEGYGTLGINVQRPNWRTEVNLHTTPTYLARLEHLRLNHDGIGCYFCGFPDGPFLEIHHLDGDHDNWDDENLRAACSLCHRLQHLGWVGIKSQGVLIHLPADSVAVDNDLEDSPRWSLEVFNILQRFYLMTSYMTPAQQNKIESLPLKKSINALLGSFRRRNYEVNYNSVKKEAAIKIEEQKKLQNMTKEEKDEYFKKQMEERQSESTAKNIADDGSTSFLSGELHIIDLVDALCEEHKLYEETDVRERAKRNPVDTFFETQQKATFGRLAIWFNEGVFEPFEPQPDYTLKDRMDYYNELGLFSSKGITKILHTARQGISNQANVDDDADSEMIVVNAVGATEAEVEQKE